MLTSEQGSAHLERLAPGIVLFTCMGSLAHSFYAPMVEFSQRELDTARTLVMFVDGWDLRSVDTGFRESWTAWFKVHRERVRMELLVRTKMMEMAASIANLFSGFSVITTYSNAQRWQRACAQSLPNFSPRKPHNP